MAATSIRSILLFFFLAAAPGFAYQSEPAGPITPRLLRREPIRQADTQPDLRVDVPLVQIPVHVTNSRGASVTGLTRDDFALIEDGVRQQITHFSAEDAPISIGMLFDSSGSMRNKIRKSSEAAAAFFKTANADDEFFLVEFSERAKLSVPFTRDSNEIYKRIAHSHPLGRTSLLDAIHLATQQMRTARNLRKAIVIFSDGGDNRSRYTESEIMHSMREAGVQVYAMGIFDPDDVPKKTPEERNGPKLLENLAEETGGRHYAVNHLDDLPAVCEKIGTELRYQYMLGYTPQDSDESPGYRHVKVLVPEPLRAHYRTGYSGGQSR
jgi:Ca-activated chloride channel family protein